MGRHSMRDESSTRLYIPALRPLYDAFAPLAWPLARFIVGVLLMPHGWGKLFQGQVAQTAEGFAKMGLEPALALAYRSEEHTSELQSLMRISYAVFCLKKKIKTKQLRNEEHRDTLR